MQCSANVHSERERERPEGERESESARARRKIILTTKTRKEVTASFFAYPSSRSTVVAFQVFEVKMFQTCPRTLHPRTPPYTPRIQFVSKLGINT